MKSEQYGNGEEILIVEDSPAQAEMLKFLLDKQNYRVSVANNGKEALSMMNKSKPTIVISDIVMPEMDGYQLCSYIKRNKNLKDIPVILLTALSDPKDIFMGLESGADDFVTKPCDEKYLLSRIQYVLSNKQPRESDKMRTGFEIFFRGQKYYTTAERQQILNLLLSIYETAIQRNFELRSAVEGLQQRQLEISALLEASNAVLELHEFKDIARSIFDSSKNLIGGVAGYVALLSKDETLNEILFLDSGGLPCTVDPSLPMPIRGLRVEAYRTGKAVYDNDFSRSEHMKFMPQGHVKLDSVLFAPLMIMGKAVGLMGLANKPGGFTENDATLSMAFGRLAAIALYNSRTLESLKNSEEKFRSVAQSASDAVISSDSRGNIIFWNEAAEKIFGYSADEAAGKPLTLVIPERFREAHQNWMNRLISTEKSDVMGKTIEMAGLRKEGSEFPLELSLSTWNTREGVFFTDIIRDITERKKIEEELRKYREYLEEKVEERTAELRTTNEQLQLEIIERKRAEEKAVRLNRLYSVLIGITEAIFRIRDPKKLFEEACRIAVEEGLFRMAWIGLIDPDTLEVRPVAKWGFEEGYLDNIISISDSPVGAAIREGKHFVCNDIEHDPGMLPWCNEVTKRGCRSSASFPLRTGARIVGALNVYASEQQLFDKKEVQLLDELASDVSFALESIEQEGQRRRAEEALGESEERFRRLIESAPDAILLADSEGQIILANTQAESMFGYSEDELLGRPFNILVPESFRDKFVRNTAKYFIKPYTRKVNVGRDLFALRKDGSEFPVDISLSSIDTKGGIVLLSIIRDITERKKTEEIRLENERLAYISRAKSDFLANMSHELRTPLNAIIGFSELLKQKIPGELSPKQESYVSDIHTSAVHLLNLINDILDLSKVEAGKIELVIERMSLHDAVNEGINLLKEKAMRHNVALKVELDPQLDFIEADRLRFKQIFFNLLSNAVKFSKPEGGTVTVTAKKEGDMLRFSVSDTGIGIKEEKMGKLFKEFEQIDIGISKKYGGTGLGLAISKKLVELHEGKITVKSTYGVGSTFTFLLPLKGKGVIK